VADVSLNAVANLGYADCRFLKPVFAGDTLSAVSQVIGLKENSSRQTGVVHVRSKGFNQRGKTVIDYVRWVNGQKARRWLGRARGPRSQTARGGQRR
jgi:2-methylfumaryl-CoA hydratase